MGFLTRLFVYQNIVRLMTMGGNQQVKKESATPLTNAPVNMAVGVPEVTEADDPVPIGLPPVARDLVVGMLFLAATLVIFSLVMTSSFPCFVGVLNGGTCIAVKVAPDDFRPQNVTCSTCNLNGSRVPPAAAVDDEEEECTWVRSNKFIAIHLRAHGSTRCNGLRRPHRDISRAGGNASYAASDYISDTDFFCVHMQGDADDTWECKPMHPLPACLRIGATMVQCQHRTDVVVSKGIAYYEYVAESCYMLYDLDDVCTSVPAMSAPEATDKSSAAAAASASVNAEVNDTLREILRDIGLVDMRMGTGHMATWGALQKIDRDLIPLAIGSVLVVCLISMICAAMVYDGLMKRMTRIEDGIVDRIQRAQSTTVCQTCHHRAPAATPPPACQHTTCCAHAAAPA